MVQLPLEILNSSPAQRIRDAKGVVIVAGMDTRFYWNGALWTNAVSNKRSTVARAAPHCINHELFLRGIESG